MIMDDTKTKLIELRDKLSTSSKERLVCIATTADLNNPPITFGSTKETNTTIAVTIILRDRSYIEDIVKVFDGFTDYFFIDPEVKNEAGNIETALLPKIEKSKWFLFKPNDFTVDSLDMLVALLFGSLVGRKVLIVGAGNIGSKISLRICERGADVILFDKDHGKAEKIASTLNLMAKSLNNISHVESLVVGARDADLVIGCTPGIPVIDREIVEAMKVKGKLIDAGNRTILPEAIAAARVRGIEVLSLSSLGGYVGMIENFLFQRKILEKPRSKDFGDFSLITPGTLGVRGDILLDDISNPVRVYGVCDGVGGLLPREEGYEHFRNSVAKTPEISKIKELY